MPIITSHHYVSGTTPTTACSMNARMMALVPNEDPEGTYSALKILPMTNHVYILSRTTCSVPVVLKSV